jgi:hypothetical protein
MIHGRLGTKCRTQGLLVVVSSMQRSTITSYPPPTRPLPLLTDVAHSTVLSLAAIRPVPHCTALGFSRLIGTLFGVLSGDEAEGGLWLDPRTWHAYILHSPPPSRSPLPVFQVHTMPRPCHARPASACPPCNLNPSRNIPAPSPSPSNSHPPQMSNPLLLTSSFHASGYSLPHMYTPQRCTLSGSSFSA